MSPPTAIALSASGATFSVAARRAGGPVFVAACAGREQSARATDLLDDVLARAGATREDVSEVRVDRGPGSYTGLRMAIAFARVLAAFGAVQLRAATSLELIALAAWRGGIDAHRAVRPVLDARRGRAHTARIERREGRVVLATAPIAVPVGELSGLVRADEAVLLAPTLRDALAPVQPAGPLPEASAADLFDPALDAGPIAADELEPLYLMGTYAE